MSWTQSDLDKLDKAIASGATRVAYKDMTVEYRSLDEMWQARRVIIDEIAGVNKTDMSITRYVGSKGL